MRVPTSGEARVPSLPFSAAFGLQALS